ncbi:MAG: hypothetical protein ACYDEJ_13965 [Desulfitobacteriaceae bacterium]
MVKKIIKNKDIDIDKDSVKEEKNMSTALDDKKLTLKEMLDRISAKAETLTGENGMIELDPENPLHKEWFEIDKYKGK